MSSLKIAMRLATPRAIGIGTLLAACLAATPADVHPHVFAEARLEVDIDTTGHVSALKHVWRFDDVFSSTVLIEFDRNTDLELDDSELGEVSATINTSLAEFGYFQMVTQDGRDIAMRKPERLLALYENHQFLVLFQSQPVEPLKLAGKTVFGVYDPTFYTALDFSGDDHMVVNGLPAGCTHAVLRPDPDDAIAQNQATLTAEFFNDPKGTDLSRIFATRLELTCQD